MTRTARRLDRRTYVLSVAAGATVLAGCTGGGDDGTGDEETERNDGDATERPVTGDGDPGLEPLDDAMVEFMDEHEIPTGALGVARDGETLLRRGYGWADRDRTSQVHPDATFRMASVTKPITHAAIERLVDDGAFEYGDPFLDLVDVEPAEGGLGDERIEDVTVKHLIDHVGGWHYPSDEDPMFDSFTVADALDLEEPPTVRDFVRHILTKPLHEDPGTDPTEADGQPYSNVGYVLLGLVIEDVSGREYVEFVNEEVLAPADAGTVTLAQSMPEDRPGEEIWYDATDECFNQAELDTSQMVPCTDGGFSVEVLHAAGGLVGSTETLLDFLDAYWIPTGKPRDESELEGVFFGAIEGTFAYVHQRPDGVDLVALCNRVVPPDDHGAIVEAFDKAIDEIEEWP